MNFSYALKDLGDSIRDSLISISSNNTTVITDVSDIDEMEVLLDEGDKDAKDIIETENELHDIYEKRRKNGIFMSTYDSSALKKRAQIKKSESKAKKKEKNVIEEKEIEESNR